MTLNGEEEDGERAGPFKGLHFTGPAAQGTICMVQSLWAIERKASLTEEKCQSEVTRCEDKERDTEIYSIAHYTAYVCVCFV